MSNEYETEPKKVTLDEEGAQRLVQRIATAVRETQTVAQREAESSKFTQEVMQELSERQQHRASMEDLQGKARTLVDGIWDGLASGAVTENEVVSEYLQNPRKKLPTKHYEMSAEEEAKVEEIKENVTQGLKTGDISEAEIWNEYWQRRRQTGR